MEPFAVASSLGKLLRGFIHMPPVPCGAILTCHGLFSSQGGLWSKPYLLSRRTVPRGIGLIRFDFTGAGISGGKFTQSTLSQRVRDIHAVAGYIAQRWPSLPLALAGSSFGGAAAVLYAARVRETPVGVAVWAAPANAADTFTYHSAELVPVLDAGRTVSVINHGRSYEFTPEYLADVRHNVPEHALAESAPFPLLIVHGSSDLTVPVEHALRLRAAARGPVELQIIPRAGHQFDGFIDVLLDITAEWFVRLFCGSAER